MATHLAESQESDRFLEIQGGSWPSTAAAAASEALTPSWGNSRWDSSSINPSDGLEPLPSLPDSLFGDNSSSGSLLGSSSEWSSSEEGFPANSVAAQETKSLSAVTLSCN